MLIKDGNFVPWLRLIFLIVGMGIMLVSYYYIRSLLLMSIGLAVAALGGYASRAATLNIKPFDNSYKKAKASYSETSKNESDIKIELEQTKK